MNLNFFNYFLEKISILKIEQNFCLKKISPRSTCSKCLEICPQNALSFAENITVTESCTDCGACVSACPTGVFSIADPGDRYLLEKVNENTKIILTCTKHTENLPKKLQNSLLQVKCLSRLYFEILLALALAAEDAVYLYCDEKYCENCENKKTISHLKPTVQKVNNLLQKHDLKEKSILYTKDFPETLLQNMSLPHKEYDESRRQFFKTLGSEVKKTPLKALSYLLNAQTENTQNSSDKKKLPFRRQLLINSLQKITNDETASKTEPALPFYSLQTTGCYLCGVCAKLCPFSALRISNDNLEINYSRCLNCGLCIDICSYGIISLNTPLSSEELLNEKWQIIARSIEKTCKKCGEKFTTGDDNYNDLCLKCKIQGINSTLN